MKADRKQSILVPVLGDDITQPALDAAQAMLANGDARVVVLHVTPAAARSAYGPKGQAKPHAFEKTAPAWDDDPGLPRWRELAAGAHPVFVDALSGEPVSVVLAQARRFASDVIILGRPGKPAERDSWIDSVIDRVVRAAPARAHVVDSPVNVPAACGAFTSWTALPRFEEATW